MINMEWMNGEYKMKDVERICQMEKIFNQQQEILKKIQELLETCDENYQSYQQLMQYYYSKQWMSDYEAGENGNFPEKLSCGVLSEDGVDHLIRNFDDAAIHMMETALRLLKKEL